MHISLHCVGPYVTPGPDDCNCEVWQLCIVSIGGRWSCNCIHPRQCEDVSGQQQYCGSDGYTYPSMCRLKATACLLELDIEAVDQGPCPEGKTSQLTCRCHGN